MGILQKGEYIDGGLDLTADHQYGTLQIDANGNLKIKDMTGSSASGAELVVAGAASVLGKLATIANAGVTYIRADGSDCREIDWRVSSDTVYTLQKYKAHTDVFSTTLTLASFTDTNTIIINGLTYTGESTANTADARLREFSTAGATDTDDALALANLINADYVVVTVGTSVAATDKLIFTTDEGVTTLVAKATSANYPNHQYLLNVTAATEAASIVLAINHTDNVTCTTADATGDTVTVGGVTFTGGAAEDLAARTWHADSANASTAATSLAACINDATYGATTITAVAAAAVVSMTRDTQASTVGLVTSNGTRLAVEACGGVPGVSAAVSGLAAGTEIVITPTWTNVLTLTEAGDQLTVTDIDLPGVYAVPAAAIVTLTPGTPAGVTGERASTIKATSAANCTVADIATLAALVADEAVVTDAPATTAAGKLYQQVMRGWEYGYLGITNKSGGGAQTLVVGATKII